VAIYVGCAVLAVALSVFLGFEAGWFASGISKFGEEGILEPLATALLFGLALIPSYFASQVLLRFVAPSKSWAEDERSVAIGGICFGLTFIWLGKLYVALFAGSVSEGNVLGAWLLRVGMLCWLIVIPSVPGTIVAWLRGRKR